MPNLHGTTVGVHHLREGMTKGYGSDPMYAERSRTPLFMTLQERTRREAKATEGFRKESRSLLEPEHAPSRRFASCEGEWTRATFGDVTFSHEGCWPRNTKATRSHKKHDFVIVANLYTPTQRNNQYPRIFSGCYGMIGIFLGACNGGREYKYPAPSPYQCTRLNLLGI